MARSYKCISNQNTILNTKYLPATNNVAAWTTVTHDIDLISIDKSWRTTEFYVCLGFFFCDNIQRKNWASSKQTEKKFLQPILLAKHAI